MDVIKLDQEMPFGKHKGVVVRDLAKTNYNYILYLSKKLGVKFSDGVLYIAKYESSAAWHRQLCWANGQNSKRRWRDWSKVTDEKPNAKVKSDNVELPADFFGEPEDDGSPMFASSFDELDGLAFSDFGNQ